MLVSGHMGRVMCSVAPDSQAVIVVEGWGWEGECTT